MATNIKMNKNMISWSIFFIILIFGISDFAVVAPENVDLALKFYDNTATQSTSIIPQKETGIALLTIEHALLQLLNVNS